MMARRLLSGSTHEAFQWNTESPVKPADHFEGEATLLGQDFRNTPAPAEHRFQIFSSHTKLVHAKRTASMGSGG